MAQLQQLDISFAGPKFYVIPKNVPGRLNVDDFIFFNIPGSINPNEYTVAVTSIDTSAPEVRTIGPLIKSVELPFVQFGSTPYVYVVPTTNPALPRFYARLNRGSTYDIPDVRRKHRPGMAYEMARHGVLTAGI